MKSPAVSAKKRHGFALGCGCKDGKSVSVSASPSPRTSTATRRRSGAGTTTTTDTTLTSRSSSSLWEDAVAELRYKNVDCSSLPPEKESSTTASFSGLLRELSELEKSVASWGGARKVHLHDDDVEDEEKKLPPPTKEHRKAKRDGDFITRVSNKENQFVVDGAGLVGSVAVVKQSDDPRGDFRRSMLQLIVENGIVAGEDLREMLRRFLALNAPHHHDAILRAFAEIWDDVFVAAAALDGGAAATPGRHTVVVSRRDTGSIRTFVPVTPPRHRRSPPAWRV
ncbi:hypothetical protein PR202_gb09364 [Eleusine coracana subsp. coracana]|uniref:Transcription repressor n=1 Tax=Eleusine coracana subsp. coracana TaxID=191504 RepID=A0AAV5EGS1_ELECO|nr:hypothetical protein QOZ80_2BG0196470 [Eleusine coracana subsp. coracana]GJN21845.1 hypothetical protein PR202_gb09364 [Eleusine coracana subsp. coracana]